ncbi:hypothetical protein B0J14DRAFT_590761 [Halenospora varia]|nr:hypothetical protein B0J14DRAFT_590761 [Halenospora varia]
MTTAPGMSTYTSSSATPTITPPPKCNEGTNELMGFNNEPSSWCFCLASNGGNLGPFSTMKDLTTNFCAFPALPTQTISLTSHPTTINTACVVTSGTYTLGPTPTVNTFCQCGDEMVGIQTTINPAGTKYIGCGTTTTFSTITPTINPTPTAPVQCFPIHGGPGGPITDADKLLKITSPNVAALCNGTDANWRLSGPGGSSPAGNNFIKSGYTLRDDAPDDCKHFYRGNLTPLQVDLCAIPQEALIDNCPYNGGKIQTVCGEWWVTSCVLSSGICVGP